jgi:AraC-like DNA-binding protein
MPNTLGSVYREQIAHQRAPVSGIWAQPDYFTSDEFQASEAQGEMRQLSRHSYRMFWSRFGGSGTSDMVWLGDGHAVNVVNCTMSELTRQQYATDEPLIMLRASLACDLSYAVPGTPPLLFSRPEVTVVHVPKGMALDIHIIAGARQQGVIAFYRATEFASRYGLQTDDLPPLLRLAVLGEAGIGRIASFPLDERIAALVSEAIDSPLSGELRAVQCGARVAELVAFTLDAMQRTPALSGGAVVRRRDLDFAMAARARLEREYREPPLVADLAHDLGTNPSKLKTAFRELFGMTMADYCLECRMRSAQQLLLEARLTIAQVAESVGYEHQSSFTAAFRSHVGMLPREYRKHRAAFTLPLGAAAGPIPG